MDKIAFKNWIVQEASWENPRIKWDHQGLYSFLISWLLCLHSVSFSDKLLNVVSRLMANLGEEKKILSSNHLHKLNYDLPYLDYIPPLTLSLSPKEWGALISYPGMQTHPGNWKFYQSLIEWRRGSKKKKKRKLGRRILKWSLHMFSISLGIWHKYELFSLTWTSSSLPF